MSVSLIEISQLSVSERIQLVQDIWDTIAATPERVLLTDEQRLELDRRLEAYKQDPKAGTPWAEIKAKLLGQV